MNNMPADKNRRVLVIDDNRAIHDDFRKILSPATATASALDAVETAVLGPPAETVPETQFEVDSACQGQEGVLLVKKALEAGRPYAMAFVDVRMPPGMDGVETTRKIWELDPNLQIVLCTAYSDLSWDEVFAKLGHRDGLLILKKPFDAVEAFQLAHALTEKWWLHKQSRRKMEELESLVAGRTSELQQSNHALQAEVVERKRAEEALRHAHDDLEKRVVERTAEVAQERRLLRTLIDNLPDGIYAKDTAGRKTMANPADLKVLGCRTEAEAIGKSDFDLFPKDLAEQFWADDQKVIQGEPVINREEFVLDEQGRKNWLLTSKLPLRDQDGKIVGLVGIGRNITEWKQAEEALRQSHDELEKRVAERTAELARERLLLRTLIDNLPDAIYAKDTAGRKTMANPADLKNLRCQTEAEAIGKSDFDLFPKEVAEQFWAADQKVIQGEPVINREEHFFDEAGRKHWLLTSKLPLRDLDGKIVGLVGVGHDITERKLAQDTIARERQLLRTLIDRLPETFYIKDLESRFLLANEAQAAQCGKGTPSQLLGLSDADLFPAELAAEFRAEELKVFAGESLIDRENTVVFPDGREHTVLTTKLPFRDSQGQICGLVGIGHDVTERKRAEAALKENQRQLAEVNQRLQVVMDTIPVRIFWKNRDMVYMGCNRVFAEDAGRKSSEELVGETDYDMSWRDHAEQYRQDDMEVMNSGNPKLNYEEPQTTPDGKQIWLRTSKVPLRDINNHTIGILGTYENVTERKRAEEALRYEQSLMATLMDNVPAAIYFKDTASRFIRANRALSRKFGLGDPAQLIGKSDTDFFSGEHAQQALADEQEIIRTGQPLLNVEEKETWMDGTVSWVLTTKLPLRDAAGRGIGTCGISLDITERKRVEQALAERTEEVSQRNRELAEANTSLQQQFAVRERIEKVLEGERNLLRTLIDNLPDYVYAQDAEGRFVVANLGMARQLGFSSPNEVVGKSNFDLFPHELATQYHLDEQEIIRTGKGLYHHEGPAVDASKKEKNRWVSTTKVPLRNDLGEVTGFVGLGQDITERKRAEEALRESQALYYSLAEQLPVGVFRKDREGRFVLVNPEFCRLKGMKAEDFLGKTPREVAAVEAAKSGDMGLATKYAATGEEHHEQILQTGKPIDLVEEYESADGRKQFLHVIKLPVVDPDGKIIGTQGIQFDITERKRAEEALQKSSKELQERNDELARFTYTVSHDLKSPLVTIKAFLGYLEQDTLNQDTEAIKKDRQYIYTAVDKMTRLLDELLDLARIGRKMNPPEEVPLQVVVKDALDMVAGALIQKGVEVVVTKEPIMLCGDRTRLVEVFQNLVDNAIKFMGDQPTPRVEIGVEKTGDESVFFVRDNGMGIDPRYQPKVFGLFEKYDPGTKGSGIGLALVKRIVEVHGGKIWVESAGVGKGATFRFTLAKTQPHPTQP
jgi:PAS domain S-box-containing protein